MKHVYIVQCRLLVNNVAYVIWFVSCTAWCLKNESVNCVVLGASNVDQLYEDMQSIQVAYTCSHATLGVSGAMAN